MESKLASYVIKPKTDRKWVCSLLRGIVYSSFILLFS